MVRLFVVASLLWLAAAGCRGAAPPVPPPPVAAPCTPMRVGAVRVVGASPADVPALAVLEGTIVDPLRTERVIAVATEALHHRGHPYATVRVARRAGCFTELDVTVALGPRFRIARIELTPDDPALARAIPVAEQLAAVGDALGTVNTVGGVYIEYRLVRALARLEQLYRDAGWLDAKIGAPTARYGDAGRVTIEVPVRAGPRYRIGAIRARGAGAAARAAVLEEIRLEPGAWYDGPAIRHGLERARTRLDRRVDLRTRVQADRREIELEAILEGPR